MYHHLDLFVSLAKLLTFQMTCILVLVLNKSSSFSPLPVFVLEFFTDNNIAQCSALCLAPSPVTWEYLLLLFKNKIKNCRTESNEQKCSIRSYLYFIVPHT